MAIATLKISEIKVENRAREEMGDLEALKDSIEKRGLITPLAVYCDEDGCHTLLAGGRRLEASKLAGLEEVPVNIFSRKLTELEKLLIEEAENSQRKDLTWHEQARLESRIHEMRVEIYGARVSGGGSEGTTIEETAKFLGRSKGSVSESIAISNALDIVPDLFTGAENRTEALKRIKKARETVMKQEVAEKIAMEVPKDDLRSRIIDSYIVGDFFERVKDVPDGYAHLIELDPPYGINLNVIKKGDGEGKEDYKEVPAKEYKPFMDKVLKECYRIASDNSWLICWYAIGRYPIQEWIEEAGFKCYHLPAIWPKNIGQSRQPEVHLANSYDTFLYAWKGRPALAQPGHKNVFEAQPVPPQHKVHPAERPIELTDQIYNTFVGPGHRIVIPFAGSGNGIISAYKNGIHAIGFEISKAYKDPFIVKVHEARF